MDRARPTVAFTIGMFNAIDGPSYCVYTQAYGLEMTIDDEWPINTIIMSPPHLVSEMTRAADVMSMGAIAGASYTPGDGDFHQIRDNDGRWVLARPTDNLFQIVAADLGVLLLIENIEELEPPIVTDIFHDQNLIVAFPINSVSTIETAEAMATEIKSSLNRRKMGSVQVLVSGSFDHKNLLEFARLPNVNGLLLLDASFDRVIEVLAKLAR